jgi:hypothetical protein
MFPEHALSILIPLLVIGVLWVLVRHWILPFVLGFALAVALGPSARPLVADTWAAVVQVGNALFGSGRDLDQPPSEEWDRRTPRRGSYEDVR